MKKRDEIPVCDTWNLADILPSDEAWEALFLETERELAGYKEFEGHLAESGEVLFQCLKFDEDISLKIERLFVYGREKSDEDTAKAKYQDFSARARRSPIRQQDFRLIFFRRFWPWMSLC